MTGSRLPSVLALAAVIIAASTAPAADSAPPVTTLHVGWAFSVTGRAGLFPGRTSRAVGTVVVRGRWGTGAWRVLTTTRTDTSGRYHFTITPRRRGYLALRITPPDAHDRRFVLHVL